MYHVILRARIQGGKILVLIHDAALHGKIAVTAADCAHHTICQHLPLPLPLIDKEGELARPILHLQSADADADASNRLLPAIEFPENGECRRCNLRGNIGHRREFFLSMDPHELCIPHIDGNELPLKAVPAQAFRDALRKQI